MRLVLIAIQGGMLWGTAGQPTSWALLGGAWIALVLGPLAELLPVPWQRPASVLRVSQLILAAIVISGYVGMRFWRW